MNTSSSLSSSYCLPIVYLAVVVVEAINYQHNLYGELNPENIIIIDDEEKLASSYIEECE